MRLPFSTSPITDNGRLALIDATAPDVPRALTQTEFARACGGLAGVLAERGLKRGERVGVLLPNGADFGATYLACLHGGYAIVPLNPEWPHAMLTHAVAVTRPALLIIEASLAPRLGPSSLPTWSVNGPGRLIAEGAKHKPLSAVEDESAILCINFTSGTASQPKAVCHRAASMVANVAAFAAAQNMGPDTRMFHVLPMAYMAGFLNTILLPLVAGGSVVLAPRFDARAALRFWEPAMEHGINNIWLTPTMAALLARLNRDPAVRAWTERHLPMALIGTAPLPNASRNAFEGAFGCTALESYGMSEVMLVSADALTTRAPRGSVGRPLDGIIPKILPQDRTGTLGAEGGELLLKTPYALVGYLDAATGEPTSPLDNGWLATGDLAHVDAVGHLFITGRVKDLIIHGGTNVSPRAVEEALLTCAFVHDAAVIGQPHPFWGEEVVAFVQIDEPASLKDIRSALLARCQEVLSPDAVPTRLLAMSELPRNSTGKVNKQKLRQALAQQPAVRQP